MELVEVYRGNEIKYGEHKGRKGYRAVKTLTFNLNSARNAIDKAIYSSSLKNQQFNINYVAGHTRYSKVQIYSTGSYYDCIKNLSLHTDFRKLVYNVAVI